jgi:hypothetical protein
MICLLFTKKRPNTEAFGHLCGENLQQDRHNLSTLLAHAGLFVGLVLAEGGDGLGTQGLVLVAVQIDTPTVLVQKTAATLRPR